MRAENRAGIGGLQSLLLPHLCPSHESSAASAAREALFQPKVVCVKFCKIGRSCVLVMRLDGVRVSCALAGRP
ncbi:hypothetical protein CN169_04155, partial [Sinorhizobium meliloti]